MQVCALLAWLSSARACFLHHDCFGRCACSLLLFKAPPFSGHDPLFHSTPQISEDHCWLQLGHGQRETTVEVTTDTAAKRGLPVAPDAWRGWLYTGGRAVLCSPHQALAALVTSINPSVSGGKKGVSAGAPVPCG